MENNCEGKVALPAGQPRLTAKASRRMTQKMKRRASSEGRALLKKQRQKRDKKRPKRHTTPNQKRKKIALAKKASCTPVEHVPGPETPLQQCPSADPSLMVPDVSGSEVAVLPANSDIV